MERSILKLTLESFDEELSSLEDIIKSNKVEEKIKDLNNATLDASFWQDQKKAKTVIDEKNDLTDKLDSLNELKRNLETLKLIYEMSIEDEESLVEADEIVNKFNSEFDILEDKLLLGKSEDKLNAIMEIHSGAGGTESLDWCQMLFRMYQMYAQKHGFAFHILDYQDGDVVGIKSVSFSIEGRYAYGYLKGESGVHRLVRLSPFDSDHARHTTFASVSVTPEVDDDIDIVINDSDIRIDIFHSSGAGGQGVNTTDSAVRITHIPTKIVVCCQNERSQIQNKEMALKVLKSRLYSLELEKRREEEAKLSNKMDISFGSQIRSYVFHPYTLVKDHRTGYETSQGDKVMDGDLDGFISAYLKMRSKE